MTAGARIAIVHHHLRPGGVTRVISRTVRAMRDRFTFAILSGEDAPRGTAPDCRVETVGGLGYAEDGATPSARDLAGALRDAARTALGGPPDLWHVHNHSLGKNPALAEAVARMAADGERLLLHIHDFAEDGRPSNYRALLTHCGHDPGHLSAMLYPLAGNVHYATLNSRDRDALARAGIPEGHLHLVHNPVEIESATTVEPGANAEANKNFLYPSRAIRRKNIGELLLWAATAPPGDRFAVTMAPQNPSQRPAYDAWVRFAYDRRLPVDFEVGGGGQPLAALLRASTAAITTSITEGFGLAFLEPALAGRPIIGRDLPEITRGLAGLGVDLPGLYARLDVPISWVGADRLRHVIADALSRSRELFGRGTSQPDIDAALAAACRDERVDFGRLDEAMQRGVIERLLASPGERSAIAPADIGPPPDWRTSVTRNRQAIAKELSPDAYARRLGDTYAALLDSRPSPPKAPAPDAVLDQFLDPRRFLPLMT